MTARGLGGAHLLLAAYAVLCATRAPRILLEGRFWAEEATVYFHQAVTSPGFATLLAPQLGYYSGIPNVAAAMAAAAPLELAPRITVAIAFVAQVAPVAWLLYARRPAGLPDTAGSRALAVALLAFVATSQEVWLNTITSQFHLALATGLILATPRAGPRQSRVAAGLLGVAGLTGVLSAALAPLFWIRAHTERSRARAMQATILTGGLGIQLWAFVLSRDGGGRGFSFDPTAFLAASISKGLLTPVLGLHAATRAVAPLRERIAEVQGGFDGVAWAVLVALAAALFVGCRRVAEPARSLFAAGAWVWLVSFASALAADKIGLVSPWENHRYSFAPVVLVALGALCLATTLGTRARKGMLAGLIWVTLTGAWSFHEPGRILSGPSWPREVAHWRRQPAHALAIWPPGWRLQLPPPGAREHRKSKP